MDFTVVEGPMDFTVVDFKLGPMDFTVVDEMPL